MCNISSRIAEYFNTKGGKVTLGIDGFVDEVWQVVNQPSMVAFSKSIYEGGGGGYTNEIVRKRRRYGGFTSNTGHAVGCLGFDLTMIGSFGKDNIDPVFKNFERDHKVISVSDPCICQIFEFEDGKLMLPSSEEANGITWDYLTNKLTHEIMQNAYGEADIVGLGYWFLMPHFNELLTKLCENYLINGKCKRVFFDFADIRKRDKQELLNSLKVLEKLNPSMPMTLSLNEHEGGLLFSYMGKSLSLDDPDGAKRDIDAVRQKMGINEFIIHTPYFAVGASATEGSEIALQDYCKNPVITAGAGDNFNGGYLAASVRGELPLKARLMAGNAVTGFYIRNGYSPSKEELLKEGAF